MPRNMERDQLNHVLGRLARAYKKRKLREQQLALQLAWRKVEQQLAFRERWIPVAKQKVEELRKRIRETFKNEDRLTFQDTHEDMEDGLYVLIQHVGLCVESEEDCPYCEKGQELIGDYDLCDAQRKHDKYDGCVYCTENFEFRVKHEKHLWLDIFIRF
jgi:hypothetical protein